ncbi:MAG: hypothetical protein H0X34_03020 [Chthoniobacterales bacterium]|nr:hypothetical protein [Chthoniobacterales bacterium]
MTPQKRFSGTEPLLLESYESLQASQGAKNPRTRLALQRLVALYDNWGELDPANTYRTKLAGGNF